jgi:hypothetical protein
MLVTQGLLVEAKENSFSFREKADVQGCTSVAAGRMPGATRMRDINQAVILFYLLSRRAMPPDQVFLQ